MDKAIVYYTDGRAKALDHKPTLKECQKIVGGYIEIVGTTVFNPTFKGQMVVNEDGHSEGLPFNSVGTHIYGRADYAIVGNVLVLEGSWQLD